MYNHNQILYHVKKMKFRRENRCTKMIMTPLGNNSTLSQLLDYSNKKYLKAIDVLLQFEDSSLKDLHELTDRIHSQLIELIQVSGVSGNLSDMRHDFIPLSKDSTKVD